MPRLSVLLAYHCLSPYLRPAVQSLLAQTFADFELILVDDGTGAGLGPLGELGCDPRIRLLSFATNRGIPAGLNAALALARGELIALMDSDDIALPRRFEQQVAAFRSEPDLGLLYTAAETIDAAGRVTGREFTLPARPEHVRFSGFSVAANSPSLMARREVFAAFPFREEFQAAPDYDFFSRAVEAWPSRALPEVLFQYRRYPEQTTVRLHPTQVLNACIVRLLTARRRAGRPEDFEGLTNLTAPMRAAPPAVAVIYAWFAERALVEDFPVLAAYLARKFLGSGGPVVRALALAARAWRRAGSRRSEAARLFFTGPLQTYGLRPV